MCLLGDVLKDRGWEEAEVDEMVHLSTKAEMYDDGCEAHTTAVVDSQAAFDNLLLNAVFVFHMVFQP